MRHHSLPQTMTAEQLGEWIDLNKVDTHNHMEKIPYTEAEVQKFEHDSSTASRAIDKLKAVKDYFDKFLKKGTPYDQENDVYRPINVTIPPTKGTEALEANRKYADEQIERGYREDITKLFLVPNPEELKMVMVEIDGTEWSQYSRDMTKDEAKQFGKPLLQTAGGKTLNAKFEGTDEKTGQQKFTLKDSEDVDDLFTR